MTPDNTLAEVREALVKFLGQTKISGINVWNVSGMIDAEKALAKLDAMIEARNGEQDLWICRRTIGGLDNNDGGTRYYTYEPLEPYVQGWQPIETAPRDVTMDTYGDFVPTHSTSVFRIRYSDDYISSNTPYPLTKTHHDFDGMHGRYTRTHWMPLPKPPTQGDNDDE